MITSLTHDTTIERRSADRRSDAKEAAFRLAMINIFTLVIGFILGAAYAFSR